MGRKTLGGAYTPISIVTHADLVSGRYKLMSHMAIPANYVALADVNRPVEGGTTMPVYFVADEQIANGEFKLVGGPRIPVCEAPAGRGVDATGRVAIPLWNEGPYWWLVDDTANLVPYQYLRSADMVNHDSATAPGGGRTYVYDYLKKRVNQDGYIRRFWTTVNVVGGEWKFKLFRPSGANYNFVIESAWTPPGLGLQSHDLVTPLGPCQPGDVVGVYLPATAAIGLRNAAGHTYRYADGDITTTNAFATQVLDKEIHLGGYGYHPFLVVSGDSIPAGHATGSWWYTLYEGGPTGTPTSEIWNQMRAIMPGLEYQNYSYGGQTYSWVNVNGFAQAYTTYGLKATAWLVWAGVNDVDTGRVWAAVEADLDAIRARCVAGDLFVCEILPWTNGNDAKAATLRAFNANIAAWCAANNAHLISCHDAMGQIRPSTGELDDLKAVYDQDGVHLTQAGVDAMAAIIKVALRKVYA